MIKEATIDVLQLQGIVKERNEYRRLLDECLNAFDTIPNSPIHGDLIPISWLQRLKRHTGGSNNGDLDNTRRMG